MASSSGGEVCAHCDDGGPIVFDSDTSTHVCSSCGAQHSSDPFQHQIFTSDGVRHYSLLPTTDPTYRDLKIYRAQSLISTLTSNLSLSPSRSADVLALVSRITDGEFALSDSSFLSVLAAACSYVVARQHRIPLSLAETADAAGCDSRQISRMLSRVLRFLEDDDTRLPEFDSASALYRLLTTHSKFKDRNIEHMVSVGGFLIQCAAKWFLSTGRRPMPLVAAVAAFVAELDGADVPLADIAESIKASLSTSTLRLKELKEALVRVARNLLPWGKDVDSKNLMQNAPLLLRMMQMKAGSEPGDKMMAWKEDLDLNLDGVANMYPGSLEEGRNYFKGKLGGKEGLEGMDWDELKSVKLSEASVSDAYKNVLERIDQLRGSGKLVSSSQGSPKKRREEGLEAYACIDYWDSDRNLILENIVERDVGYDALPPSFVNGIESRARRKEKIGAAKIRINQIMNPTGAKSDPELRLADEECPTRPRSTRKRRIKRKGANVAGIDWEDCIIELLILHRVNEEEIEQGQYSRLLDLHVFSSLGT